MSFHLSQFDYNTDSSICQADFEYTQKKLIEHMKTKENILPLMAQAAQILKRPRSYMQNLIECGSILSVDEFDNVIQANFCHARLCPVCAWKRSLKLYHNVKDIVKTINMENEKIRYLFVTVTQPNVKAEKLNDEIDKVMYAYKKFRQFSAINKATLGAIKTLEVTYNEIADTYHPHIHIIFAVPARYFKKGSDIYLTASEISALWAKAINSEVPLNTDITAIKKGQEEKAIAEVCKYAVKLSSVTKSRNVQALAQVMQSIHGRRLFTYSGVFRDYAHKLGLVLDADTPPDGIPQGEYYRIWSKGGYKRIKQNDNFYEVWIDEIVNKKENVNKGV